MNDSPMMKIVIAGVIGTVAMTALRMLMAMFGFPPMDMGMMLGTNNPMMPMSYMMGWVMHFVIGIMLTAIYALFLMDKLPSTGWMQGAIYSLIPWLVMSVVMAPMMGMGMFGGTMTMAFAGLVGHLAYGAAIGYVLDDSGSSE